LQQRFLLAAVGWGRQSQPVMPLRMDHRQKWPRNWPMEKPTYALGCSMQPEEAAWLAERPAPSIRMLAFRPATNQHSAGFGACIFVRLPLYPAQTSAAAGGSGSHSVIELRSWRHGPRGDTPHACPSLNACCLATPGLYDSMQRLLSDHHAPPAMLQACTGPRQHEARSSCIPSHRLPRQQAGDAL